MLLRLTSGSFLGLTKAVAFAISFQDVATVCEPIQEGSCESLRAKHLGPLLEREVRGKHEAVLLVCPADHLEEELGAGLGERHIAELIEEQEMKALQLFVEALEPSFLPAFQ